MRSVWNGPCEGLGMRAKVSGSTFTLPVSLSIVSVAVVGRLRPVCALNTCRKPALKTIIRLQHQGVRRQCPFPQVFSTRDIVQAEHPAPLWGGFQSEKTTAENSPAV